MSTTTDHRRTILVRVALPIDVYEHTPGEINRFRPFSLAPGSYPAEVRAVDRADMIWLCLQVPGCEARVLGGTREMFERRPGVTIESATAPSPVEPVADSPPAAAGRPEIREPLVAKAVADLMTTGMAYWGESATEAEVREIHRRAKPLMDAGLIPDGQQAMAQLSRDRLCGHPLAVSGVVVPEAEPECEKAQARPVDIDALAYRIAGAVGCYGFCSDADAWAISALIEDECKARRTYGSDANHAAVTRWVAGVIREAFGIPAPDPSIHVLQRDYTAEVRADVDRVREIAEERARTTGEKIG